MVKINLHRGISGTVKTVTVQRDSCGRWHAIFSAEGEPGMITVHPGPTVGLDVGLEKFAALSDGSVIENPRYLRKTEKRLKHAQRALSRKQKASRNRKKARLKVARLHAQIRSQRRDFLHKASRRLVNTYSMVAVEDLAVRNMVKNRHLAKSISDAGWSEFLTIWPG